MRRSPDAGLSQRKTRKPMTLSDLLLHSEVASFLATERIRQFTLSEIIALRDELSGKSVWLRDDERPKPGTYLISDEEKGEIEAFSGAKSEKETDLRRVVEIHEHGSQEALAVDIDILDIRLGRIVVYAKEGLARVAGEKQVSPTRLGTPDGSYPLNV